MKVDSISYPVYSNAQSQSFETRNNIKPKRIQPTRSQSKEPKSAMGEAISTAGAWFGFGVVLDFISRKITFFHSPMKNSLAMNGVIGAGAGLITGVKTEFTKLHHKKTLNLVGRIISLVQFFRKIFFQQFRLVE